MADETRCNYLAGQQEQLLFVHPHFQLTTAIYGILIAQGFRRSGDLVYCPRCPGCKACIPARLAVADFMPNRSQKRCAARNRKTTADIKPAKFVQAHYEMYLRYQASRHSDGAMAKASPDDYMSFAGCSWCNTRFVEFAIDGDLAAVAVVDELPNALSAVYTFFEPRYSGHSPGIYAVLWQIEQARIRKLKHLYLGYWIKECRKMAYKGNFKPLQVSRNGKWTG